MVLRYIPGRLDRSLALAASLAAVLWAALPIAPSLAGLAWLALLAASGIGAVWAARRVASLVKPLVRKLLWRVRNRMVAVFFFVGVLPISLGALIVVWGLLLLLGPVTAHTVFSKFQHQSVSVGAASKSLLWQLQSLPEGDRLAFARSFHERALQAFPGMLLEVRLAGLAASFTPDEWQFGTPAPNLPAGELLLRKGDQVFVAACLLEPSGRGRMLAAVPVREDALASALPGLLIRSLGPEGPAPRPTPADLPAARGPFDWVIRWPIQASFTDWDSGEAVADTYILITRPSAVWNELLTQETDLTKGLLGALGLALIGAFLLNLLLSLFVAASITRTMTRAVNELYEGTRRVNRGDFSHRIPIKGSNQISSLSDSFNSMTASVEGLIEESKQRQQLEAELEIAREVQAQLFPAQAPVTEGLEILGVCRPARSVSGDFFDYVRVREGLLAISFGDVSGKGISAALVMASLHSAVRAHLSLLAAADPGGFEVATGQIVRKANVHLCESTASNKFSTLFFGAYDPADGTLVYANAGHLPPLLLRSGRMRQLEITGIVVGAFPNAVFGTSRIALEAGDLLVLYTDGLTEPEDRAEQEFGEARLRKAILGRAGQRPGALIKAVMDEVVEFTGAKTLQDDMTMLVVRKS